MPRFSERVYYKAPWWAQNLAVSAMGLKLARERSHPVRDETAARLREEESSTAEERVRLQEECFIEFARSALVNAPHYRTWADSEGVDPDDIRGLEDLLRFPVLDKQAVRDVGAELRADTLSQPCRRFRLFTSGTTGTPLTIHTDAISRSKHYAYFDHLRARHGVVADARRATFYGRIIMSPEARRPPFWRYDAAQRNLLFSSYHLAEQNLPAYYDKLVSYRPDEIFGYPSSLFEMARFVLDRGRPKIPTRMVLCTAETLLPHQKESIRRAFEGKVVNQYGCTEMAFFASSNDEGRMVFEPGHGIVEVLRDDGVVAPSGTGALVATGLVNAAMPVMRYLVGDRVTLMERDADGRQWLSSIEGRLDDVIYRIDGTPVGRLDPIFKGGADIAAAQIEQRESGDVVMRVVPGATYDEATETSLMAELRKRIGRGFAVEVERVSKIERGKNGKFRAVIGRYVPAGRGE